MAGLWFSIRPVLLIGSPRKNMSNCISWGRFRNGMKLFHLFPSAQESPAESERIFRGAASPGTERNRPPDGQQQGGLPGRHDRVRDAQADHVRRRAHSLQRMEVPRRGLHGKDVVSHLTLSSQSLLPLISASAAFLLRIHVAYCCRLLFI